MNFNKSNVYSSARRSFQRSLGLKSTVWGCEDHVWRSQRMVRSSAGFTLIELLVAMAILMVIVLMLANLFQQSTRAWETGIRQTEMGLEARGAVNMIQRELSQAIYTNGAFYVLNDLGEPEEIDPGASSGFAFDIQPVSGYDDLYEVRLVQASQSRMADVRVWSQGL